MRKAITCVFICGCIAVSSANASIVELDCEMQSDLVTNLLKSLPPAQAARMKEELEKRVIQRIVYTLDTEKKSLRLRWRDPVNGGYQWRTVKNLQKRTLPDDVIAYAYEREDTSNHDQIKSAKEMILIAPEVKTVIQATYGITHDGQEAGATMRGACK